MLSVVIDANNAIPKTGTGVYGTALCNALQMYGSNELVVREAGIGLPGKRLRPMRRIVYLSRLKMLSLRNFDGADVVHFTNVYAPQRHATVASVSTIHDLDALLFPHAYTHRYSVYYERTVSKVVNRVDLILTDTDAVRRMIVDRYNLSEAKVAAAGIGLDSSFKNAIDLLPDIEFSKEPYLFFVGRLEKKKNIAWLIRIYHKSIKMGALPRMKLVVAGGVGYGFEEIRAAMRDTDGLVEWVPSPNLHTLATLYKGSTIVVLPSLCEGFGIPILEALYCGKPVVVSRIPTSVEVGGDAVCSFELGNLDEFIHAMRSALKLSESDEFQTVAAKQIEKYTWTALAPKYIEIYETAKKMR